MSTHRHVYTHSPVVPAGIPLQLRASCWQPEVIIAVCLPNMPGSKTNTHTHTFRRCFCITGKHGALYFSYSSSRPRPPSFLLYSAAWAALHSPSTHTSMSSPQPPYLATHRLKWHRCVSDQLVGQLSQHISQLICQSEASLLAFPLDGQPVSQSNRQLVIEAACQSDMQTGSCRTFATAALCHHFLLCLLNKLAISRESLLWDTDFNS